MAECYRCGDAVSRGQGYRREVYTGHSSRIYWGRRVSASSGSRFGVRTVCSRCAGNIDQRKSRNRRLFWGTIGVLFVLGALSHNDPQPPPKVSAASAAVVPVAAAGDTAPDSVPTPEAHHKPKHRHKHVHKAPDSAESTEPAAVDR
jgi:hypothetical protein